MRTDHVDDPSEDALFRLISDLNDADNTFAAIQSDEDESAWFASAPVLDEGGYEAVIIGALLDRVPQSVLTMAVARQVVGMLGFCVAGTHPAAALVFLLLMDGPLGPVSMTTQNAMPPCAPGRTDTALAANSGSRNVGIAVGAALGRLVLPLADVRGAFPAGGLLRFGACTVLVGGLPLLGSPTPTGSPAFKTTTTHGGPLPRPTLTRSQHSPRFGGRSGSSPFSSPH
ncbi:hypothetical protein SAMN05216268_1145 [Streptomyces yunnanensis]|uniref:Uncharacterized protein n=1 Tax=Streptomyces yunnanensis TaxID=156453 RepID=A0A9X8N2J0_9ACTN|nr:hypothetical protein SAMN05216268_1145 [Streptomyces yunnanensis]